MMLWRKNKKEKLEKWQEEEWITAPKSRAEKEQIYAEVDEQERQWQEAFEKWNSLASHSLDENSAEELEKLGHPMQSMMGNFVTQVRGIPRHDRIAFLEDFGEQYARAAICCFAVGYRAGFDANNG